MQRTKEVFLLWAELVQHKFFRCDMHSICRFAITQVIIERLSALAFARWYKIFFSFKFSSINIIYSTTNHILDTVRELRCVLLILHDLIVRLFQLFFSFYFIPKLTVFSFSISFCFVHLLIRFIHIDLWSDEKTIFMLFRR